MNHRNIESKVRLNRKEAEALNKKDKKSRISREAYLRHLINGVVPQDAPPPEYFDFMRELHGIGNNLNQIAKRVNSTGHLYEEDIADLKTRYGELWGAFGSLLSKLDDL